MSMKKLAVLSAIHHYGGLNETGMNPTPGPPPVPVHGVNVILGGAMISGIILIVFVFCYCCHKKNRKLPTQQSPSYWRDPSLAMEIYTLEVQNCFNSDDFSSADSQRRSSIPGPPPAYDVVVPFWKSTYNLYKPADDTGLPSYDSAIKLQEVENGHV